MGETNVIFFHLMLLSITLSGCLSLPTGSNRKDFLEDAELSYILNAPNSQNDIDATRNSRWEESPGFQESKRSDTDNSRQNLDRLMADIESALQYLEDETDQNSELFDKRLRRPTSGRRQHNFIRIGKRVSRRRCQRSFCFSKRPDPMNLPIRPRSRSFGQDGVSNKGIRQPKDLSDAIFGRVEDPYNWNAETRQHQSPMDASSNQDEQTRLDLDDFNESDNYNHQGLDITGLSKRRIHRFVRFGRRNGADARFSSLPPFIAGVQYASPAPKRGRLHKFVRFGRSIRPFQRQADGEFLVRSQEVPNAKFTSTPSVNMEGGVKGNAQTIQEKDSLEETETLPPQRAGSAGSEAEETRQ